MRAWRAVPLVVTICLFVSSAYADQRAYGWCQKGAQIVTTVGIGSSNVFQQTFASCTVTVYLASTLTLATIYSDNSGTSKANPFAADTTGFWFWYAANGRYDVSMSGGATTISDILLSDFGSSGAITSLNGLTGTTQTFATGTSGTNFGIVSAGTTHTFNLPTANGTNTGLLANSDWTTFNGKQAALSVTAPITLTSNTIAITLPVTIAQGGTGQITAGAAFTALAPLTTVGDLLGYNGTSATRFGVGSDAAVLTADHTQAFGFKWAACTLCTLTSPIGVANGGTGLSAGTSGGIPAYTGATTLVSSTLLVAGSPVLGGGAGAAPSTTGVASSYNGQTLAGNGLAVDVFSSQVQTNQTSTHTTQAILTAPPAGNYKVSYYLFTGSVSDNTATAQVTFNWTDTVGAKATTPLTALALAAAANQTATYLVQIASGNLTYTSTYVSGAGGNYNLLIIVERL